MQTPVFALQSSLDSWVVANVQCEDYHRHTKEHRLLQPHGLQQLKDRFSKVILWYGEQASVVSTRSLILLWHGAHVGGMGSRSGARTGARPFWTLVTTTAIFGQVTSS